MPREKPNYRDTFAILAENHPLTLRKREAAELLGCSLNHLKKLIQKGYIKDAGGKIPLGSIANYLCG